ncbi:MAG TPA: hypothetical protein VNX27_10465 [Chthoniobacterales bacterium]|nr:hypothetical protein [Chthoniobacterales bacterium]
MFSEQRDTRLRSSYGVAGAIALYLRHEPQTESWIKLAMIVRPATGKAGNGSSDPTDARKFPPTIRTMVNKAHRVALGRERQIVTTRFVGDSQIATGFAPFFSVRRDSSSPDAKLCEQMRQLMPQRPIDLVVNHSPGLNFVCNTVNCAH